MFAFRHMKHRAKKWEPVFDIKRCDNIKLKRAVVSHFALPALAAAMTALLVPLVAGAQPAVPPPNVALDSAVYVEHTSMQGGEPVHMLEPAGQLAHGARVVTLVSWFRLGGSGGFTVTNTLPRSLHYQLSANGDEQVSVDGGKSWGHLGTLQIGARLASPEDVTHVRWRISEAEALAGSGRMTYSGLVR